MPSLTWQPPACRAPSGGFSPSAMTLTMRNITADGALCNDGTPAKLYYRPCCDGEDPGDWCNASAVTRWVIAFGSAPGDDGGWCWDASSCAARARRYPNATSSAAWPTTFTRDGDASFTDTGVFSKSGEGNPNFYNSHNALVPSCSSDLFVGRAHNFRGRAIALGAIAALRPMMDAAGADSVVISGGAGVMSLLPDLRAALPPRAIVSAVCDGCVLFDDANETEAAGCSADDSYSCRPAATLPRATRLWGSDASLAASCGSGVGWRCLLDAPAHAVAKLGAPRVLAQQPLYDARSRRAHASLSAEEVRSRLEAALAAADVAVGSACAAPAEALTRAAFTSVTFGRGLPPPSMAAGLLALVSNTTPATPLVDDCRGVGCNPTCAAERSPYHVPMGTGLPNTLYGYVYGATAKAATQQCTDAALTAEDVAHYRRDGFVVRRGLLSAEEVALVRAAIEADDSLSSDETTIMLNDDAGGATRLNLWSNPGNGTLGMLARSRRIVTSMRTLLGGDVLHYHSKTLIKQPHAGGAWNWHQDYGYWYKDFFLLPHMATAYVAVDAQDAQNGALTVLNGSHALGRLDHWTKGDQQGADLERVALARERYAELQLNLAPGDVVFFDALLLHTSPGNFSPRRRAALGFAFTRSDNEQFRKEGVQYIPCWPVHEVDDSELLKTGVSVEGAEEKVMLGSARGRAAAAKAWGG